MRSCVYAFNTQLGLHLHKLLPQGTGVMESQVTLLESMSSSLLLGLVVLIFSYVI